MEPISKMGSVISLKSTSWQFEMDSTNRLST